MSSIIALNTEQKDLSIRVHSNGFSFYLSDHDGEIETQHVAFSSLSSKLSQLKDAIYNYPILFSGFRSYHLIIEASQYILTPALLFDPDAAQKQTNLLFSSDTTKEYFFEEILPLSMVNCYSFDSDMYGFLNRTFQFNQTISLSSLLILETHNRRQNKGKGLFIYVNDSSLHFIVHSPSTLEFQVCYPKFSAINCCYYALKAWEIYQLDQKEDTLHLIGDNDYCDSVKSLARQYVEHIEIEQYKPLTTLLTQSSQQIVTNIL